MYRYDEFDARFVAERVAQFKDQTERRLSGELTEEEFRGWEEKLSRALDEADAEATRIAKLKEWSE